METRVIPMTVAELLGTAAELPFCAPSKLDAGGYEFPCGLQIGTGPFMAEGETANAVTEQARYIHAKHHIDGHIPLYGVWNFVAKEFTFDTGEKDFLLWCSCDELSLLAGSLQ